MNERWMHKEIYLISGKDSVVDFWVVLCIVCPLVVQGWSKQPYALPLMAIGLLLPFVYFFVFGGAQLAKNRQKKQHV